METITRATVLGGSERTQRNRELSTLVISPEAQDIGSSTVAAGYEAATTALAAGGADSLQSALR